MSRLDYAFVLRHPAFESLHHDIHGYTLIAGTLLLVCSSMDEVIRRAQSNLADYDSCEETVPWRALEVADDRGYPSTTDPVYGVKVTR